MKANQYRVSLDFETYSLLSVKIIGADRYSRLPSTEVLMGAYAFENEPVKQWIPAQGEKMPRELLDALRDPLCVKFAWNKSFEWSILANTMGIVTKHEEWRDPMVLAMALSFPGSLEKVGHLIGLPDDKKKMSRGKSLIRKFCGPRKPTKKNPSERLTAEDAPEEWEEFLLYNRMDVEAERAIWKRLVKYDLPPHEWGMWFLDQEINQAGVPINLPLVDNAIRVYDDLLEGRFKEMTRLTTLPNPNSNKQILPWLKERGYPYDDCQKGHIKRAIDYFSSPPAHWDKRKAAEYAQQTDLKEVLGLRLESAKSSPKKYGTLRRYVDDSSSVIRNVFQFAGAGRTSRWCIAEGSLVLVMLKGGTIEEVPIEVVSKDMFVWDGGNWVEHEGVVFSGDKEVITWDGVCATPEHKVYVSDTQSLSLGEAQEKGTPLWGGEDVFDL